MGDKVIRWSQVMIGDQIRVRGMWVTVEERTDHTDTGRPMCVWFTNENGEREQLTRSSVSTVRIRTT